MHSTLSKAALAALGIASYLFMSTTLHATVINGLIAYPCRTAGGFQNICLVTPAGTGNEQITFGGDNALPSWSPDGTMLAYTHYERDPNTGMESIAIAVLNIADLSTHLIAPGFAPAWSPDGSEIAFTRPSPTSPTPEIWTMKPDGTDQQQVTDVPGVPKIGATWSPDDKFIAYAQADPTNPGHNIISVTRLADKFTYVLTNNFCGMPPTPCFQNLDANGDVIASQPVTDAGAPAWSPVSNEILFWSGLEGSRGQIWQTDSNGQNREQLTFPPKPLPGFDYPNSDDPVWSPDGTKILFDSNRMLPGDPFEIPRVWMMNADGTDAHPVIENTFGPLPGRAAWQPVLVEAVPEPASFALLGSALLGFGLIRRRKPRRRGTDRREWEGCGRHRQSACRPPQTARP